MSRAALVLKRCFAADGEIEALQFGYDLEKEMATDVSQKLEAAGDRHAAGTPNEKVANGGCEMARKLEEIEARKACRSAERIAVARMLKSLPLSQGKLIHLYYIQHIPLGMAAHKLGYSYGYARRMKTETVEKLEAIPDEEITAMMPPEYSFTLTRQEVEACGR
jgi:hypothetical protein